MILKWKEILLTFKVPQGEQLHNPELDPAHWPLYNIEPVKARDRSATRVKAGGMANPN